MTERLRFTLRKPEKKDAAALLEYLNTIGRESDYLTFGSEGHPLTVEQEEAFIESLSKNEYQVMLLAVIGDDIIGNGALMGRPRARLRHTMELAISVKKAYWNQGVASAIMEALFVEAKKISYVTQLSLHVREDNASAVHLYEKLGFVRKGVFPHHMQVDGQFYDSLFMIKSLND